MWIVGIILFFVFIYACYVYRRDRSIGKNTLVGMRPFKHKYNEIIVYKKPDGSHIMFKGDCTVWCKYPSGVRLPTYVFGLGYDESTLSNIWQYCKNRREFGDYRFLGRWNEEEMKEFLGE